MARVADAPAADRPQVHAARRQRLGEGRHRAGLVLQLDHELVGHGGDGPPGVEMAWPGFYPPQGATVRDMIETDLPAAVAAALEAPTPGERIAVEAAGIPWSALAWGDPAARPLLLIHGVTSSAAVWWRLGPALAATGRRVVAVDQAGHGRTGHWQGHHRFRDNAADVAAFVRAAGLDRDDLQVVGHCWGAMTAAALPVAGLRPATLVLLDPPAVPHAFMEAQVRASDEQTYDDMDEAIAAVRAANPGLGRRRRPRQGRGADPAGRGRRPVPCSSTTATGTAASPISRTRPLPASRSGSCAAIRRPAATSRMPVLPAFAARIGADHITTIAGGPHSPQRTHPAETTAALLRALEA